MTTQQVLGTPVNGLLVPVVVTATATCPAGTQLLGGGFRQSGTPITLQIIDNSRDGTLVNQWNVSVVLPLGTTLTAVAECTV